MFSSAYHRSEHLLSAAECMLLLIDLQERFVPVVPNIQPVLKNAGILAQAAGMMSIPVAVSEQYPKGLGPTAPELSQVLPAGTTLHEKISFSALPVSSLYEELKKNKKRQIVIAGIETHVCVQQTVFDLLSCYDGWVYVVVDAVNSRHEVDKQIALERMARAGAHLVTTEMVVFEWVEKAGTEMFKKMQKLVVK